MDEYIKVSAKTVDDAIMEASIQLGTTRDNIEYRVIEHETKGFLGIGAKKAVIEARRKVQEEDIVSEVFREKPAKPSNAKKNTEKSSSDKKNVKKAEKKAEKEARTAEKKAEKSGKPDPEEKKKKQDKKSEKTADSKKQVNPKKEEASHAVKDVHENVQKEEAGKEEKVANGESGQGRESIPRVPADPEVVISRAQEFLTQMLSAMGVSAVIHTEYEEGVLSINLEGEDMGVLIGKRGQTLDSIQYLTSLVVNKGKAAYVRVKIDTENYRERRKATLENLAKNMAFKVKKTRRPAYLEPMNPYERRIIHSALQSDPYVTTHSEGEEPARKVVITLRRHEREEDREISEE